MGRKKTKYTKADACIYIIYCILRNEFNNIEDFIRSLEISSRQVRRYVAVINLALADFMLEEEIEYDRKTGRFILK